MAPSTLEQFIRFGTDAAAIERMLRMAQSIAMVVAAYPPLLDGFAQLVVLGSQEEHAWADPRAAGAVVLGGLKGHLALARRFFRMFRFLESFHAAYQLYTSLYSQPQPPPASTAAAPPQPAPPAVPDDDDAKDGAQPAAAQQTRAAVPHARGGAPAEAWLDMFGRTFNGMYLLLETLCLVDAMQVPGLSPWGPARASALHVEGQRFWVFALGFGVASGLVKIVKMLAYAPVPPPPVAGEGHGTKGEKGEMADWERERERLRRIMWARKEQGRLWRANVKAQSKGLVRRCVADLLDIVMPGTIVGWWKADQGTLGVILIVTTYLTGWEVWERCGREVASR
ncbi:hypothetical protein KVR01_012567 [Diaporthe batatas]|uniref:uncharacterized protein n=1 Tax=Diaporthe batatas TaxID=748121 RepID=UPI001D043811|nr:uncharacterized protein KVR01_012567 [Diaporthe batatas]KAG8157525.1 hypothetical protein KVR01_012567 [Diaporthe batatas]